MATEQGVRKPHIQVIGSVNIDLVTITPRVPEGGETLTATSFATHAGGKGANQAVACARASRRQPKESGGPTSNLDEIVRVSMVGAVGQDTYADFLLSTLENNGIGCDQVQKTDTATGVSVILVEEASGQNRILFTPGANYKVTPELLPPLSASQKPDLIVMQLELPTETVLHVLQQAKQEGIDVLLNPAPATKLPADALNGLAHLVLNETEAAIMCDLSPPGESDDLTSFLDKAFGSLWAHGVLYPIITLGGKGVAFTVRALDKGVSWKSVDAHRVPKVVDTTAAGDTFVGYYAVGLVQAGKSAHSDSWDPTNSVLKANRAAARTVTKAGASESIPYMDELDIV